MSLLSVILSTCRLLLSAELWVVVRMPPVAGPTGGAKGGLRGRGGEVRLEGGVHAAGEVGGRGRHAADGADAAARVEQPGLAAVQEEGTGRPLGHLQQILY